MFRTLAISILSVAAVVTLNAGQIQLGGSNGLITSTSGSTVTGYVVNATTSSCAGATIAYNPGFTNCETTNSQGIAASTTNSNWIPKTYAGTLFGSPTLQTSPAQPAVPASGAVITDPNNNVTFQTGLDGNLADFGYVGGTVTPGLYTLNIPVGVFGVDSVSTLLEDFWGANNAPSVAGAPSTTGYSTAVVFEFNQTSSDGSSGTNIFDTVYLQNGFEIGTGVNCSGPTAANIANAATANDGFPCGSSAAGAPSTGLMSPVTGQGTNSDATITTTLAYGLAQYTNLGGQNGFSGTVGNVSLADQTFTFGGNYNGDFLVGIQIENQMKQSVSKDMVGAVTVDQLAPEPSSVFLFLTAFGSIGFAKFRRRK